VNLIEFVVHYFVGLSCHHIFLNEHRNHRKLELRAGRNFGDLGVYLDRLSQSFVLLFLDTNRSIFVLGQGHVRARCMEKHKKGEFKYIDCCEENGKKEIFASKHSASNLNADVLLYFLR
jgi:hypothetical protein